MTEKTLTAEKFGEIIMNFYVPFHGPLDIIVSDRDTQFTSEFWAHLTKQWETKLAFSTAFYPQMDGQAKKANSIVKRVLRAFSTNK
jgi:hypothetical protein